MDFKDLCGSAAKGGFDLLVIEAGKIGGYACELVKRLRHGTFGTDPFRDVVMTAAEPGAALIQQVVKAGSDQILRWPFSDDQLAPKSSMRGVR